MILFEETFAEGVASFPRGVMRDVMLVVALSSVVTVGPTILLSVSRWLFSRAIVEIVLEVLEVLTKSPLLSSYFF